jgi:hypothetical protein
LADAEIRNRVANDEATTAPMATMAGTSILATPFHDDVVLPAGILTMPRAQGAEEEWKR